MLSQASSLNYIHQNANIVFHYRSSLSQLYTSFNHSLPTKHTTFNHITHPPKPPFALQIFILIVYFGTGGQTPLSYGQSK